jgi:dTDP-4-amino-4,6-dideoxygalactose transaminase
MKIPFVDLKAQYLSIKDEIDHAISTVISETSFIGGFHVNNFEQEFQNKYGVNHCISCANGTDSLYIIMKMLGIGSGDEVITVANSWISTSETISQTGATPVFVDCEDDFFTINVNEIEAKITENTRAIIPVHLYGQMCDMDKLIEISKKHSIFLIEDCAQSHFSKFNNVKAGLHGHAASFSFYPGKNLGAYGDAGAIITNNDSFAESFKMFARHGALVKHKHIIEGINSRMDGLQAAILSVKLKRIEDWTRQRQENAKKLTHALNGIENIKTPAIRENSEHSFHLYVIQAENRDGLAEFLKSRGIEVAIHYPTPLPLLPAYEKYNYKSEDFPVASNLSNYILSLPLYPELSEGAINYIASSIKEFYSID